MQIFPISCTISRIAQYYCVFVCLFFEYFFTHQLILSRPFLTVIEFSFLLHYVLSFSFIFVYYYQQSNLTCKVVRSLVFSTVHARFLLPGLRRAANTTKQAGTHAHTKPVLPKPRRTLLALYSRKL